MKDDLQVLRDNNSGYNPEPLEIDNIESLSGGELHTKDGMTYHLTECFDEIEYIEKYYGIPGVIHKRRYYAQD